MMQLSTYVELTGRTESLYVPGSEPQQAFDMRARIQHMLLGVLSEVGELADAFKRETFYGKAPADFNVIEELGDVSWYCGRLCALYQISKEQLDQFNSLVSEGPVWAENTVISDVLGSIVNIAFCFVRSQDGELKPGDVDYVTPEAFIFHWVWRVPSFFGVNGRLVRESNIAKLMQSRYGECFDTNKAINRNLTAEIDAIRRTYTKADDGQSAT